MKWTWEIATGPPPPTCGTPRGRRSQTHCELPPDHVVGRATGKPIHWIDHFGRSRTGRWYSWRPKKGEIAA